MTFAALRAFDAECERLAGVLETMEATDFDRPSNCPPWTLHELTVHIAWSIGVPERFPSADDLPSISAAGYYRRPERDTTEYRDGNVRRTQVLAAHVPVEGAAGLFATRWQEASRMSWRMTRMNGSRCTGRRSLSKTTFSRASCRSRLTGSIWRSAVR